AFTNYFPKVDAGAVAMKSNKYLLEAEIPEMNLPVYDGNPANIETATQFAYFPGMELNMLDYTNAAFVMAVQPLYVGGKIRNGNKLAALAEEVNEMNVNLTTDEVLAKTEEYYWNIVALSEKKKTLDSYQKMLENLLSDVTVSYNAGLVQKSDMLKVKFELSNVESNKLKLENGLSLLKMMLCIHMGIPYSETIQMADTELNIVPPTTIYTNPEEALQNRYEYQMLGKAIDAETLQKRMARGEFMPQLAVGVQGMYLDMMDQHNTYGLAFATLSVPLSGWWGGSHKIQEHQIKVAMAQNSKAEKSELLVLQINKSYLDLSESYDQIQVATNSLDEAQEYLNVVRDNYEAGIVTTSDLLEAQAMLQKSQDGLVNAQTRYKINMANYLLAIAKRSM
ncbi:MAG: TolC family protein, partial [Bacteroidales bacterium]